MSLPASATGLLQVLVALSSVSLFACLPDNDTPGFPFKDYVNETAVVRSDVELLAAFQDPSITDIVLGNDIVLGPPWSFVSPPVVLTRNVTVRSSDLRTLNLNYYPQVVSLGPQVVLTFTLVNLKRYRRVDPFSPGLDLIANSDSSSTVVYNRVLSVAPCCPPLNEWSALVNRFRQTSSPRGQPQVVAFGQTRCVQELSTCVQESVSFLNMAALATTIATSADAPDNTYTMLWNNLTLLCETSVSSTCTRVKQQQQCLQECLVNYMASPTSGNAQGTPALPPGPTPDAPSYAIPPPAAPPLTNGRTYDTSTKIVIWATVVPSAVILTLGFATFLLYKRWRRDPTQSGGKHMDDAEHMHADHKTSFPDLEGADTYGNVANVQSTFSAGMQTIDSNSQCPSGMTAGSGLMSSRSRPGSSASTSSAGKRSGQVVSTLSHAGNSRCLGSHINIAHASLGGSGDIGSWTRVPWLLDGSAAHDNPETASTPAHGNPELPCPPAGVRHSSMEMHKRVQQVAGELLVLEDESLVLGPAIGRGAYGTVYKGRWRNLDVAVKTMLFSQHDGTRHEKAVMEAALASSVVHPNVVAVYHYDMKPVQTTATHGALSSLRIDDGDGPHDWKLYLVQELCQASLANSLEKWVFHDQRTGRPRMDLILAVLKDVADGCSHIHSKNIIWADLKPENVLLKMDPSRPHGIIAKIADFGMSATIDPKDSHISGFNKGTPYYSAPEVVLSHQATKTSDVFSFGVLMQQMLTRTPPWTRAADGSFQANPLFWNMVPAPADYLRLRTSCLDPNPKKRPSFEGIIAQLDACYQQLLAAAAAAAAAQAAAARVPAPTSAPLTTAVPPPAAPPHPQPACTMSCVKANNEPSTSPAPAGAAAAAAAVTPNTQPPQHHVACGMSAGRPCVQPSTSSVQGCSDDPVPASQLFQHWPMSEGALGADDVLQQEASCQRTTSRDSGGHRHHGTSRRTPSGRPEENAEDNAFSKPWTTTF